MIVTNQKGKKKLWGPLLGGEKERRKTVSGNSKKSKNTAHCTKQGEQGENGGDAKCIT